MDGPLSDPGGTSMEFQSGNVARVTPLPARPRPLAATSGRPARVFDLAAERVRRLPPPEALAAVDEAARVYAALDAAGLQVRFDLSAGSGVQAELRDASGSKVRALTLAEVVDPGSLLPPDSAA